MSTSAAGIDAVHDEDFKQKWMSLYLETHPTFQGQEISEALLQQWLTGFNKGAYVSGKVNPFSAVGNFRHYIIVYFTYLEVKELI
jgi:hypothetical protein